MIEFKIEWKYIKTPLPSFLYIYNQLLLFSPAGYQPQDSLIKRFDTSSSQQHVSQLWRLIWENPPYTLESHARFIHAKWEDNPKCRVCGEKVVVVRVGRGNGEGSGTLSHQWHSDLTSIMLIRLSLSLPLFSLWPAVTVGFSFSISWMPTIMISAHAVRCSEHVSTWPAACKCMSLKGRRIP